MDLIHFLEIRELLNDLTFQFAELLKFLILELLHRSELVRFLEFQLKVVHALALSISVILLALNSQLLEIIV